MKHAVVKCHDYKCGVKNGNKKSHGRNIEAALSAIEDIADEHITIAIRAKDKNGQWYSTISVIPIKNLQPGDEIKVGIKKINKLVIK